MPPNIHAESNQDMETSATSFFHLLRDISEAVSRKESLIDYDDSLRKIFGERGPHDTAHADSEVQISQVEVEHLPILKAEKVAFGRDHEKEQLLSKLLDPDEKGIQQLSVIPILGGGGIGTTTLARLVYEDEVVKERFELRVWVKVDGHEFSLQNAAHGILKSAMGMSCSLDDLDELDEMVRDTLQSQRCLIVFDGIESMAKDSWFHMNQCWFGFVDLGSKVLITTPSEDVANLVANRPFELTRLSPVDGLSMLCRYLALDSSEGVKDMSRLMAEHLLSLCQGIPLLLKLVGSLMRYDHKLRDLLSSVDFFNYGILLPPSDASVAILLCVWALPPHLRQCLAYCAIFPKGYALNKEKIIAMWIADGLVKPSPGNYSSLEDIGNTYFLQLLCRSLFTDITCNEYGDITEFRMSGLIHKISRDVARILWKGKLGVVGSIDANSDQLSLVIPFAREIHLQTLILSPTIYLGGGSTLGHSLLEFKGLQSLDLSCSGIRNLSDDIRALKELRYLNLSYTLIERVPDSMTDLSRLQTLDLSWCYHLKVLPKGMCNLTDMIHLDLSLCDSLSYLPSGIGFLRSLTSMPLFVLGKDHDCARLGELGLLNQLRGRLEIRNLENAREIIEPWDPMLLWEKNLHHLGLSWSQNADNCFKVLELLEPNPQLKVLDLTGYMGFQFPRWLSSINSVIKISIMDCGCEELPSLGQLPFLKELLLKGMTNIEFIGEEFYGDHGVSTDVFPSLEQLGFYDMPMLLEWSSAIGSGSASASCMFRSLKILTIEGCPQLPKLPSLPTLPELIVWNSNDLILSSLTNFESLSSLLIKDMGLRTFFKGLSWCHLLKKLILFNIKDLGSSSLLWREFTALEHLGILHCHQLRYISLPYLKSLQKLHIVDCRKLRSMYLAKEGTTLMELVIDDCPQVYFRINIRNLLFLRKLIIRSCSKFTMVAENFKDLEKLEYLSISGCPRLERQLEMKPSLISHIPCVKLGNPYKANYKDSKDFGEVPFSASLVLKHYPWREPKFKVLSGPLSRTTFLSQLLLKSERAIAGKLPTGDDHSPAQRSPLTRQASGNAMFQDTDDD